MLKSNDLCDPVRPGLFEGQYIVDSKGSPQTGKG